MVSVEDLINILKTGEWVSFVNRPFSLFIVSIWHYSYEKYIPLITRKKFGISDGIFVQEINGVVRNYRKIKSLEGVKDELYNIYIENRQDIINLLMNAREINNFSSAIIGGTKTLNSLDGILDLICKVTVYGAVLPRFLAEMLTEHNIEDCEIVMLCEDLKKVTFYPKLLTDVYLPKVIVYLSASGIENASKLVNFILINELKACIFEQAENRSARAERGESFVYVANEGSISIRWSKDISKLLVSIDEKNSELSKGVMGKPAFLGRVRGTAHVCITLDGSDLDDFKKGDVLVSINSSPNLMKWISIASAIITDEGGITCHAAIVSRELKIPCIIGTGQATKIIKNGDIVDVDANTGRVSIL